MVKIKFLGAAKTVTGSNYLVTTDKYSFVVDCGMFQGPDVEYLNLKALAYDASKLSFVILTHAHIDHSGMLPKLTKAGFNGNIYATSHSVQISTELLLDSAKIQENAYQRGEMYGRYTGVKGIVFNTKDSIDTIGKFKVVNFEDQFEPVPGIKIKFLRAGHILGAASIEVDIDDNGVNKKIIFSGDVGRLKSHIIDTFDVNYRSNPDYVIIESLYGGQIHPDRDESARQLVDLITQTVENGGNVFIPCFAVQRAQEVLNDIKNAKDAGAMPREIPVWLDSPLAQRVTNIYTKALQTTERDLFNFDNLVYVKKAKQSAGITLKTGNVILAGSGMADGGRIQGHLIKGLQNSKNSVIFVGFQAEGTLGRQLIEGEKRVTIGKNSVKVNAQINHLQGFSAHGDNNDYTAWIKRFINPKLKRVFYVHAEEERAIALKNHFQTLGIQDGYIPSMEDEVTLD